MVPEVMIKAQSLLWASISSRAAWRRALTVSYTHLDVYKRQAQSIGAIHRADPAPLPAALEVVSGARVLISN